MLQHSPQHRQQRDSAVATRSAQNIHPSARSKRPFEPSPRDFDAIKQKKAKITVEILSRHPAVKPPRHADSLSARTQQRQQQPLPLPTVARPNRSIAPAPATTDQPPAVTKHREKVINGIKHELDRLQPSSSDTKDERRKLRSQEATRFKSDLSAYFPDYDEIIGNDPREQRKEPRASCTYGGTGSSNRSADVLNIETPIVVLDPAPNQHPPAQLSAEPTSAPRPHDHPVRSYGDALFTDLFDSRRVDFGFLEAQYKGKTADDPLPDRYFEPAHRKAERLERSIRNSEKGRAQHEKDQIIRLLDGLQGHDWLRTMGVSGITEGRKKTFEPAREHFIKGCKLILEKFRLWGLEEKRRKQEKDRALAEEARARAEEEESQGREESVGDEEAEEESEEEDADQPADEEMDDGDGDDGSDGEPPEYSDVDESIAKQLREEAMARSKVAARPTAKRPKTSHTQGLPAPPEPLPQKDFTSFFQKRYQREAALSTSRRKGRTVLAWGHPVPEPPARDFELPEEYRDEDTLRARARRKRRDRRGH